MPGAKQGSELGHASGLELLKKGMCDKGARSTGIIGLSDCARPRHTEIQAEIKEFLHNAKMEAERPGWRSPDATGSALAGMPAM